jgi:hypothetical protein
LDKEQLKAIKSLERAFKKCRELKINFYGMDESLHAISKIDANETTVIGDCWAKGGDVLHDSLNESGIIVKTYGSYRNSGGF